MDNREAKFILSAYRPAGQDAKDSRFAEALDQAQCDPVLERWFRESIAFDTAMTEKLCAVPTPVDLRENILAGVKVTRPESIRGWKNRLTKLAIAAAVILSAALGGLIWHNTPRAHLVGWQSQALDVVSSLVRNESSFDAQSHNATELLDWLRANHAPATKTVPQNLATLKSLGCKTFFWSGKPLSVICFVRPGGGLIHLITMNASAESDREIKRQPRVVQHGHWATATWREGEHVYMVALEGSLEELRPYFS
jgi:hypothetical protein